MGHVKKPLIKKVSLKLKEEIDYLLNSMALPGPSDCSPHANIGQDITYFCCMSDM